MSKKSKALKSNPSNDRENGAGIPHVVRVTLLGLSGLSYEENASDSGTKPSKANGKKVPMVPKPPDVRAFVSLSRQTLIGTKYLPPLCRTVDDPVNSAMNDNEVEINSNERKQDNASDHYHISWPEDGVSGRANKFVFETLLPEATSHDRPMDEKLNFDPKVFNLEIGLFTQQEESEKTCPSMGEVFGIVLGSSSLAITGYESCPPKMYVDADLSTTIFSQVQYLPILKPTASPTTKRSKQNGPVRVLKNHNDVNSTSSDKKARGKKASSKPPSKNEVQALQSKYSFQSGQGYLVVTVEVYRKASDEEQRIDFIRKQIKKQTLNINTSALYQMVRYLSAGNNFPSEKYISRAIEVYAQSTTQTSTTDKILQKRNSSDSDPAIVASKSSLMDQSDDESESTTMEQEFSTDDEQDSRVQSNNAINALISRMNSCQSNLRQGLAVYKSKPPSFSLLAKSSYKGITEILGCQTRVDPALLKETHVERGNYYDDDQTIFSGIPYVSDQKI